MRKLITCMIIFACLGISAPVFAISITAMDSGADMAQSLVGSGITISNVTYTGANAASGYFKGGLDAGIGIEEGIVLTSGNASNIDGTTNKASDTSGEMGTAGNAELDALIPGATTMDAAVLEFDFVSIGDAAYFNYVFGSEEYNEWVDSEFNDVFGFFIDDVNYALLPKTSTPVSINSVNNGSHSEHYNDNDYDDFWPAESPFAFEYDGFTDVLTASITGLTAGQTYHLKLAIADTNDAFWDSGVFLEAGSFSEQQPSGVPEPSTMFLLVSGIGGLVIFRKKFMK